jgi:hypothetical protein
MDDLTRWIARQIDADAAVELRVVGVNDMAGRLGGRPVPAWVFRADRSIYSADGIVRARFTWAAEAAHITRWGPAHVLDVLDVWRRILVRHEHCGLGHGFCDDGGHGRELDDGTPVCADKLDLAAMYAGRPGYREQWRVTGDDHRPGGSV